MRSRRLAAVLSFTLALQSPGLSGWVLFAQELSYESSTNKITVAKAVTPAAAPQAVQMLDQAVAAGRLSREDAAQAKALINRYGVDSPEVDAALQNLSRDLSDPGKDAKLTLADLYDRMTPAAKKDEATSTYVQVLNQAPKNQTVAVRSTRTGAALFYQHSVELDYNKSRRVITRPDPLSGKPVIEAVMIVEEKGSAEEQKILYNRKVHLLFRNLKKLYYDQCQLARKINNGERDPMKMFAPVKNCKLPNGEQQYGFFDKDLTESDKQKGIAIFNEKQKLFRDQAFRMKSGQMISLIDYLKLLDEAVAKGTTHLLKWEDLEAAQRLAMAFYGKNQLETMQKYVIIQLTSYFGQVTNSTPKQEKDGSEKFDATGKSLGDLQKVLESMEKGNLEGYGWLMRTMGLTELSHEDQRYITHDLMTAAGEAFAYVAYAVKANARAMDTGLSDAERDSAIEEGQQWLRLTQIQLQTFEMHSLAIQLERLRDGRLRDNIGLLSGDTAGKAEATRLREVALRQYLPRLKEVSQETKQLLLKQSVAAFFMSIQNTARAQLYADTIRDRLKGMAAKILEMRSLFLAAEFEKVKDQYTRGSAMDKLNASAYQQFLANLPPNIASLAADLEAFARSLTALTGKQHSEAAIRAGVRAKIDAFAGLARRLGFGEIPNITKVKEEAERHSVKHTQFFAALQDHASKMRMFDMLHELDQYLRRYASPEMPDSDNTSAWDKFVSFKWLDSAIDWVTGGGREKAIEAGMKYNPLTKEAFQKLGGPAKELRREILDLMAQRRYEEAYRKMETLDAEAAKRARAEWEADQMEKDPFEQLDMISFLSKTTESKEQVAAQGVVTGLFGQLQTYILGYTATAAAFDMVFMSLVTAGVGQFAKAFIAVGRATVAVARALQAARIAEAISQLTRMQRLMKLTSLAINLARPVLWVARPVMGYMGRMLMAWGRNLENVLDLKKTTTTVGFLKNFGMSYVNAFKFTAKNMLIMSLASGGMQVGMHKMQGDSSQYKGAGDAFFQGMIGGAKFGATGGMLMLLSPIPATALGNGALGRVMQGVGTSAGPISGTISMVARSIPKTAGSAVARSGVWGAAGEAALAASPAMRALVNMAVWGGAMVDGALKFFLVGEGFKQVAEVGAFAVKRLIAHLETGGDPKKEKEEYGATGYINDLTEAQHIGLSISHASWLLIPVNTMHGPSQVREQKEQLYGFSRVMRREGGSSEILTKPNGEFITYNRSIWHRMTNGEFFATLRGRSSTQGRFQNNQQFKEMAGRMSSKGRPLSELAALSTVNGEVMAGNQRVSALVDIMQGKEAPAAPSPSGAAKKPTFKATPNSAGKESRATRLLVEALETKAEPGKEGTLYAYFSEGGALQRVSSAGGGKKGVRLELKVTADGRLELAPSKANAAALKRMTPEGSAKIEGVLGQANTAAASGRPRVLTGEVLAELVAGENTGGTLHVFKGADGKLMVAAPGTSAAKLERLGAVELQLGTGPSGEVILARGQGGELAPGNLKAIKTLGGNEVAKSLDEAIGAMNKARPPTALPEAPASGAPRDDVFVTAEALGSWRKLMENHLAGDKAMRRELITNAGEIVELRDPKTGQTFKVTGEPLKQLREMAKWQELNVGGGSRYGRGLRAAQDLAETYLAKSPTSWLERQIDGIAGENPGLLMRAAAWTAKVPLKVWRGGVQVAVKTGFFALELTRPSVLAGFLPRAAKTLVGKEVPTQSEMIVVSLRNAIKSGMRSARSDAGKLEAVKGQVEILAERLGPEGEALGPLRSALSAKGRPETVMKNAREELAKLAQGISPALVFKIKRGLMADDPPKDVVGRMKEYAAKAGDSKFAQELREKLDLPDPAAAVKAAAEHLSSVKTEGAPLETLAAYDNALQGKLTAAEMNYFARRSMDSRIRRSGEFEAAALRDLRQTLESDAIVELANTEMTAAVKRFQRSDKKADAQEDLRESVDLVIDTWEQVVFGQVFRVSVEKASGEKVWEVPKEFQFKDAGGNAIPSFRQGQFEALRKDFLAIAGLLERPDGGVTTGKGVHQIYNLLQTSGGKTLMSFVLASFLQVFSKSGRGKEGAMIATANADLVSQGMEAYKAFFKGRKPSFEILDYGELMARQAQADQQGTLGPFETHDVVMDEFDMIGMGTPLSLGKFNGQLSFSKVDPMQMALRKGVAEAWEGLYAKFGHLGKKSMNQLEFAEFRKQNPAFDKEFRDLVAKTTHEVREAMKALDPMISFLPANRQFRRALMETMTPEYLAEKGFLDRKAVESGAVTPKQLELARHRMHLEMVREHREAFGGFFKLGVLEAKYGSKEKWVEKVLEGAFEAATEGEGLGKLYMKDPQRDAIIQFHNDQAMDSLDTHYRTSLEVREGVAITLDFETQAVTDFRKINQAAKDANAVAIALSGTLPDGMRPFFKSIGVTTIGKGTDPRKADKIPHEILQPRPELVKQFDVAIKAGKKLEISVDITGTLEGFGRVGGAKSQTHTVAVEVRQDGRVAMGALPKALESLQGEARDIALERIGLTMDQVNAARFPAKDVPHQLATAREGIMRLLSDARFKGTKNIAYVWVESLGKMKTLLKDLDAHGITMERSSILTSPGSNFFLQERYMFTIKTEKNIEGVKAGEVDVVVLAGQGGLRGLEAPLGAYGELTAKAIGDIRSALQRGDQGAALSSARSIGKLPEGQKLMEILESGKADALAEAQAFAAAMKPRAGGEIKMFVTDSYSLADVSLLQLLGRIDRGRVPPSARTTFALLDDAATVMESRNYTEILYNKVVEAASGMAAVKRAQLEKAMGRPLDEAMILELFLNADRVVEKSLFRDYVTLDALEKAVPAEKLEALAKLPAEPPSLRHNAALELMKDPAVMKVLVVEGRRLVEKQALGSAGIDRPGPTVWQQFLLDLGFGGRR